MTAKGSLPRERKDRLRVVSTGEGGKDPLVSLRSQWSGCKACFGIRSSAAGLCDYNSWMVVIDSQMSEYGTSSTMSHWHWNFLPFIAAEVSLKLVASHVKCNGKLAMVFLYATMWLCTYPIVYLLRCNAVSMSYPDGIRTLSEKVHSNYCLCELYQYKRNSYVTCTIKKLV